MLLRLGVTHGSQKAILDVVTYREHGRWARLVRTLRVTNNLQEETHRQANQGC
jgi:hypothetical protein